MKRLILAQVLLLGFAIGAAQADDVFEPREHVVPSEMCGQYFFIPLEVDLDGDGEPTTLMAIFDTGGAGLHIDPDSVVRAGGDRLPARKQITIRDAKAGPLTFSKLRPYTKELDHLSRVIGIEIDIFLPFRAFDKHLLTLDFPKQEMRIAKGRLSHPNRVDLFSAKGPDGRPYLQVKIAGRKHKLLIDSGSSGTIALNPDTDLPWASEPLPVSVGQGMERLVYSDQGRLAGDIEIAGVTIEQPMIRIRDGKELLGTEIMKRFAWIFDQRTDRVRILPDSDEPLLIPAKRGPGVVFLPADEGLEIARVIPGTPAESMGLREGELVVAINGIGVYDYGCDRWKERGDTEVTLTVVRDGEEVDLTLEVVDIIP